jgi:hypothetical protein
MESLVQNYVPPVSHSNLKNLTLVEHSKIVTSSRLKYRVKVDQELTKHYFTFLMLLIKIIEKNLHQNRTLTL